MDVRTLLRASLVPLGVALAMRGIEHIRAEADELGALVAERRAYLAGDGPLPGDEEHQDVGADLEDRAAARFRARAVLAGVAGVLVGVIAGRAASRLAHREQIVAAMDAGRAEYLHGWDAATAAAMGREPTVPEDDDDEQPADIAGGWHQGKRVSPEDRREAAAIVDAAGLRLAPLDGRRAGGEQPAGRCKCGSPYGPDGNCLQRVAEESA